MKATPAHKTKTLTIYTSRSTGDLLVIESGAEPVEAFDENDAIDLVNARAAQLVAAGYQVQHQGMRAL